MSEFTVPILRISKVEDVSNSDRLSLVTVLGYEAITIKNEDGSHRFAVDELVCYVPEQAVVPERLLKQYGFWNDEKNIGMLGGSKGNRVKAIRLRGTFSQGLLWKLERISDTMVGAFDAGKLNSDNDALLPVLEGDNVAEFFGIVKYEEPIPQSLSGNVHSVPEAALYFDVENVKNYPDLLVGKQVVATEKLHGTCFRITYLPNADDPKLFMNKVAVASKGLGTRGLVFTNTEENSKGNLYCRTAIANNLFEAIINTGNALFPNKKVSVLGEIFGKGVQDLTYGEEKPVVRMFDVHVEGIGYLDEDAKQIFMDNMGVERVPVLYRGEYDYEKLKQLAAGKTTFHNGFNVREGLVVTAIGDQTPLDKQPRPCLKVINPEYLLRKGGTELQ